MTNKLRVAAPLALACVCACGLVERTGAEGAGGSATEATAQSKQNVRGWLSWRGPLQRGVSLETNLPDAIDAADARWTFDMRGRGAPVIANGRVYSMAYEGEGADLQEVLSCLDERSGAVLWEHRFNDFLSDVIYNRYSITSPTIDPETGNVLCMSTAGELTAFTPDGRLIWQHPLVEKYGRLTYPNGRTLGPLVDGDLVIMHTMTSDWGPHGPARDRFFAFDKDTGEHVWTSTPGGPPKDSPYSYPVFEWRDGRRLLYAGTAGGNVVCVNALTGEPVWRFQMSIGGVCATPIIDGHRLIAVHGKENLDSSNAGRMVALKLGAKPAAGEGQLVLDRSSEVWRNDDPTSFTSSPVLADGVIYNTVFKGELVAIDADTGEILWKEKLASSQIHASPVYADGKLYVPMNNGSFYVIRPTREGAEILSKTQLEGNCLGAPSIWNGKVYVHTTEKLYCFGADSGSWATAPPAVDAPAPGKAVSLQILPAEVVVRPGQSATFRARAIDANGLVVSDSIESLTWTGNPLGLSLSSDGKRASAVRRTPGSAVMTASAGGLKGSVRFRVTPPVSFSEDFDAFTLNMPSASDPNVKFARAPGYWISGWPKWDVREVDGSKALAKTIENPIFQRVLTFIGHPEASDYTMQADIMSDGNRRQISTAGLIHQRYAIILKGNFRELEIQSNVERVKHSVPFRMRPGVWYRLKTRVDVAPDGAATVRAKAWPRDDAEPGEWTIEFTHKNGHKQGAPGIYGFAPQSRHRVYMDNIVVTENE